MTGSWALPQSFLEETHFSQGSLGKESRFWTDFSPCPAAARPELVNSDFHLLVYDLSRGFPDSTEIVQ